MTVATDHSDPAGDFLPREAEELKSCIVVLLGAEWLHTGNIHFGMRTPADLIGTKDEDLLRDLLTALSVSALS